MEEMDVDAAPSARNTFIWRSKKHDAVLLRLVGAIFVIVAVVIFALSQVISSRGFSPQKSHLFR